MPVSPEVAARLPDRVPSELLQAFVPGNYDVREGDLLVYGTKEYPIRECSDWDLRNRSLKMLVVDDIKV